MLVRVINFYDLTEALGDQFLQPFSQVDGEPAEAVLYRNVLLGVCPCLGFLFA